MRKHEYVTRFTLETPLTWMQRAALACGAHLAIQVVAITTRDPVEMKVHAVAVTHRNGKAS